MYLWIDYPSFDKELEIVLSKVPDIDRRLAETICKFMVEVRALRLEKTPGIAETLDWAAALSSMHFDHLDKDLIASTLGLVLKDWQDLRQVQDSLAELFEKVGVIQRFT